MKVTDKGNYTEVELETPNGQNNFRATLKSDDRRGWQRDAETCELGRFMNDNSKQTQVVVKCGNGGYVKIR